MNLYLVLGWDFPTIFLVFLFFLLDLPYFLYFSEMTSSDSESYLGSHACHLLGSWESWKEAVSPNMGEVGIASFWETLQASRFASLDIPVPSGPTSIASSMAKSKAL